MRHEHAALAADRPLDLPAERGSEPAYEQGCRDAVAPALPDVVDPHLGDALHVVATVLGLEELGDGLAPRLEPCPLEVRHPEVAVRAEGQVRQAEERLVRPVEARRVDDEGVADPGGVEQLARVERRRVEPPQVDRHAAEQERVDQGGQVLPCRALDVQPDDLAFRVHV